MTFDYVPDGSPLPTPKYVFTNADTNLAVPMIFEILSKIRADSAGLAVVAIQLKLDANIDEDDQAVEFLTRFQTTDRVQYKVTDGSIFHIVSDRKTTPLDRIVYLLQVS